MDQDSKISKQHLAWGMAMIPTSWSSLVGIGVVVGVWEVFNLSPEETKWLMMTALPVGMIGAIYAFVFRYRKAAKLGVFLEKHNSGEASQEDYVEGFRLLVNMPLDEVMFNQAFWVVIPLPIAGALWFFSDTFNAAMALVILTATAAAGALGQTFMFAQMKSFIEPYRNLAAMGIEDPNLRESVVKTVSFNLKLGLMVCGIAVVAVFFTLSLGQARIIKQVEGLVAETQNEILRGTLADVQGLDGLSSEVLRDRKAYADLGMMRFVVIDTEGNVVRGDESALLSDEILSIVMLGTPEGESTDFTSVNSFSWATIPGSDHILISVLPGNSIHVDKASEMYFLFAMTLLFWIVGIAGARAISSDLERSAQRANEELERVASGDLTRGSVYEAEDDMGALSRSLDRMAISLRETITNVAASADRVDTTASQIAAASTNVSSASSNQGEQIRQVTHTMENIQEQVQGIQEAADSLSSSVQESSTTVSDLEESVEALSESGNLMAGKVSETLDAYEGMFGSIEHVQEDTRTLGVAASDTTSSVHETAAALKQVNANASETAKLSDAVVAASEDGRHKVNETIAGIGSIHEDTEFVAKVVSELEERTGEIGEILDVISSVADETNLLALNAAIISAQAGEHGRAFSVVADEIKGLADRVIANTKQIGAVIHSVQTHTGQAAVAIERSTATVRAGVDLSQEAGASLETITDAARMAGSHMGEVVSSVSQQSEAAMHIVELMVSVQEGVERIKLASESQGESTARVMDASEAMREASQSVQVATEDQARSKDAIASSSTRVHRATEEIINALREQTSALDMVASLIAEVSELTLANEGSTAEMDSSVKSLQAEASGLREGIRRFRV